jgi:transposase
MIGRETRMLLRHYLEQGASKSALARQLGVSRDTVHRWIRAGDLDRDLDTTPVRYGPRRPVPTKLDAYKPFSRRDSRRTRSCPRCGCWRRSAPRDLPAAIRS